MNAEQKIIAILTESSATRQVLAERLNCSRKSVTPVISRLRQQGFDIRVTSGFELRNPKYTLLSGPGSLGPSFVCPGCRATIRLGHIADHKDSCQFGPSALRALGVDTDQRRSWK